LQGGAGGGGGFDEPEPPEGGYPVASSPTEGGAGTATAEVEPEEESEIPESRPAPRVRSSQLLRAESGTCRGEDLAAPTELITQGQKFLMEKKYTEAEGLLKRGLDLMIYRCPNHSLGALAWESLALIYDNTGRKLDAENAREQARRIRANLRS